MGRQVGLDVVLFYACSFFCFLGHFFRLARAAHWLSDGKYNNNTITCIRQPCIRQAHLGTQQHKPQATTVNLSWNPLIEKSDNFNFDVINRLQYERRERRAPSSSAGRIMVRPCRATPCIHCISDRHQPLYCTIPQINHCTLQWPLL